MRVSEPECEQQDDLGDEKAALQGKDHVVGDGEVCVKERSGE